MARAPDQRAIEAKELYDKGLKLIEIAKELDVPVGTVRSWKNRQCWDNATLRKKEAVSQGTKMPKGMAGQGRRETRMQLRQESSKLSFLIP